MSDDVHAARTEADAKLDPEWIAKHGDWSWAAALALIGETAPSEKPKPKPS